MKLKLPTISKLVHQNGVTQERQKDTTVSSITGKRAQRRVVLIYTPDPVGMLTDQARLLNHALELSAGILRLLCELSLLALRAGQRTTHTRQQRVQATRLKCGHIHVDVQPPSSSRSHRVCYRRLRLREF